MHAGIVGAGAWGTALAIIARQAGADVTIWAYESETARAINQTHTNPVFLPAARLDPAINATNDLRDLDDCDVWFVVVPSSFVSGVCARLRQYRRSRRVVCVCSKGIESGTGRLMTELVGDTLETEQVAVLSGPSFAEEVATGKPTAVTAAGNDRELDCIVNALAGRTFRVYRSHDRAGVSLGGALKNVIAIACGIATGLDLGHNARAALISRGLMEIIRFGGALGAKPETLTGLSGLGDLVLTCTGELSRNLSFGMALGKGRTPDELLADRHDSVEGAVTAGSVMTRARQLGVEMPITEAVHDVLENRATPSDVVDRLLERPTGTEFPGENRR